MSKKLMVALTTRNFVSHGKGEQSQTQLDN